MASKLSSILTHYRQYQADQVLTHTQLNESIAFFEDQDRLTRIGLIGVGIVNGLAVSMRQEGVQRFIEISQGYGITTDGDLITLRTDIPDANRKEKSIEIDQLSFSHYRPFEDDKARYPLFHQNGIQTVPLLQLCRPTEEGALPLQQLVNGGDMVLMLYLESYSRDADLCGDINCDTQGVEQIAAHHFLLIDRDVADDLLNADPIYRRFEQLRLAVSALTPLYPLNVVITAANAQSPVQLDRLYRDAIIQGNSIAEFTDAVSTILNNTQFLWEGDSDIQRLSQQLAARLSQHFSFPANAPFQYNQYRYRLLSDLLEVYRRLISELASFAGLENPSIRAFPKHLFLGDLAGTNFRHGFYPSPAISDFREKKHRINSYLRKICFMLDTFSLTHANEVRLVPSGEHPASGLVPSIPFYYQSTIGLRENWSTTPGVDAIRYSYNLGENPLLIENEHADFYFLGGHLRGNAENVFQAITNIQLQFGLDFTIYRFDYDQFGEFARFLRSHGSCRHRAGVPKSGTLILLSRGNEVIGDLALSYRVVEQQAVNAISHIKVAESRYPWISTLSYLNNLARSLRGTPRRVGVMPRFYRLIVREYSINGVSQIAGITELLVPLEEILVRRMHAITDALNRRFPAGLVFDFNEQLKRFSIVRAFDDQFRITFADTTLSLNAPAFTYTEEGMFRSDRQFRINAIRNEERRRYRESTYRQLQSEFAPENKDDDFGKYQGKWAEWYRLIDQLGRSGNALVTPRLISRQNQLPASVRTLVTGVFNRLNATGRPFQLFLTGDWLDGSWVSTEMITRYGSSRNTNDPIVRFLRIRETLHHKTQATKASLFLVLGREADREFFENLASTLTETVDMYIDGPRVGRRVLLIDTIARIQITGSTGTATAIANPLRR
ncbi:hypothetical protein ADIS_1422 [Lunatimonas lonarensis]|uniref:Uncharacterized protein n=1 Tax=Lunatimonas lonarensis TaxID=1232681 RepID=R7ZVQ1_9BACT|nr:hypothetical protein [Lunatimonas lonarensis]EON78225.1 hypothetical protein ADIS_1422 [Lunatimonas lonarensis]